MHYQDWDGAWSGWWWLPMSVMMIAFWGGVAWLAIMLVRRRPSGDEAHNVTPAPPSEAAPEEILRKRLATGEIDVDDYQRRLDVLSRASHQ